MAGHVLVVAGDESRFALEGLERAERVDSPERAYERLATRAPDVDVLVLPPSLGDPLEVAQRAHLLDRDLALVLVCDPRSHARVARALQFAPYLAEDVVALEAGDDARLVAEVARAAERSQARRRLRATVLPAEHTPPAEQVLGQLLAYAPAGVAVVDRDGVVIGWNQRAGEILGVSEDDAVGLPLSSHFSAEEAERLRDLVARSAEGEGGEGAVSLRREGVAGVPQVVEATAGPLTGRAGERGVMVVLRDLTEGKEAESRLRFLADATEILAESLDYEATLGRVARLAIPMLADWCLLDELHDDGRLERVAAAAASEPKQTAIEALRREYPPSWESPQPAARALREGRTVVIELPDTEAYRSTTVDERHFRLISALAPRVALATPLVAHGETVGALTLAFSESERTYGPADVELAEGLARRAALAIDRARLYRAEQEARMAAERAHEREAFLAETTELLSSTLEFEETVRRIASRAVPRLADWCIVYVVDDSGVIRRLAVEHVDDATRALVEAELARFALDPATDAAVPKVIRTRELEFHPEASLELLAADVDDPRRFLEVLEVLNPVSWMCLPLVARDESLGAISFFTTDSGRRYEEADLVLAQEVARRAALAVDQARAHRLERQARLAAEDAQVRLSFLAEASSVLSSSLDYETTLEQLAELTVPTLADCCVVDVLHEGREVRQVAVAHVDRRKEGLVRTLERRYPSDQADPRSPVGRSMREAGTVFLQDLDARLEEIARDEEHLRALRELGLVSGLIVPLVARGQTLGAITLLAAESGRRYTEDDVALAEQLASRAALAVDNARLYGASREALRKSAESLARLESLLVTAPIGVAFFDTDLRYALLNEALAQINGLPVEDHIGRRVVEVLPDLDPAPERDLRRVIDTGEPILGVELAGVTRAHPGEWRHWIVSYYPVVLDGTTVGIGAIFVDITERKRAEEERAALLLREQAARAEAESAGERLTILAEASRILSSSLDYEATVARVARLVADRLADWCVVYVAEDGRIRPLSIAVRDSEQQAAVEAALRRYPPGREGPSALAAAFGAPQSLLFNDIDDDFLRAQAVDEEHYRIISGIGTRSAIVASIVAHDEVVGVVSLASGDASPQLTAADLALAEELAGRFGLAIDNARLFREAEARAHSARALATVGDGVVLVDSRGVVRVWNPAAEAITGIPAAEIVGRAAGEAIAGWADVERFVPVGTGPAPGGTRPQTVPLDLRGREAWLSFSAVGFEEGTVYTFRDLTEERRVEELKTEFVATASHELRTPLAAVYGAAMTLRRPDLELDDERRDILLSVITDESDRLARIVNDILWASRVDSGEVDVRIEPFDLREAARRVVEAAQVHLASDVELRLVAPESFPLVAADEQKVSQVLTNLVENAIKYSPDGGRVEVSLEHHDGRVRFAVRDQGIGIPPAEHARIFEKFYRLDPHLTRGVGGTGLGLYICRELVRRMNGRIWVSSREGEGSTFAVELPLAERQLVSTG